MPEYDIKVTSTVITRRVEAETPEDAILLARQDLGTRFSAYTEVLMETTIAEDVTGIE